MSIGCVGVDSADPSVTALLARADAALYRAKGQGRNRVESAVPDDGQMSGDGRPGPDWIDQPKPTSERT